MIPFFWKRSLFEKKETRCPEATLLAFAKIAHNFWRPSLEYEINTKYLNNLVYLLIFQKLSNFSQLATLSPFVASVFEEKNEKNYLLYSDTCISCIYM